MRVAEGDGVVALVEPYAERVALLQRRHVARSERPARRAAAQRLALGVRVPDDADRQPAARHQLLDSNLPVGAVLRRGEKGRVQRELGCSALMRVHMGPGAAPARRSALQTPVPRLRLCSA